MGAGNKELISPTKNMSKFNALFAFKGVFLTIIQHIVSFTIKHLETIVGIWKPDILISGHKFVPWFRFINWTFFPVFRHMWCIFGILYYSFLGYSQLKKIKNWCEALSGEHFWAFWEENHAVVNLPPDFRTVIRQPRVLNHKLERIMLTLCFLYHEAKL